MPDKKLRKSALNGNTESFQNEIWLNDFLAWLKAHLTTTTENSEYGVLFIMPLLELGYSLQNCIGFLARLDRHLMTPAKQYNQATGELALHAPVHVLETEPYYHTLIIPPKHTAPLIALAKAGPDALTDAPMVITKQAMKQRNKDIKTTLAACFKNHYQTWRNLDGYTYKLPATLSLDEWARLLNNRAITLHGIEPALAESLKRQPLAADPAAGIASLMKGYAIALPASQPTLLTTAPNNNNSNNGQYVTRLGRQYRAKLITWNNNYIHFLEEQGIQKKPQSNIADILNDKAQAALFYQFASDNCDDRPEGWLNNAKESLKDYIRTVYEKEVSSTGQIGDDHPKIATLEHFFAYYEDTLQPFSLPLLAMLWTAEKYVRGDINEDTLRNYTHSVTLKSGLHHHMAHDMRLWDDECVEEFIALLDDQDLTASNNQQKYNKGMRFLRFCKSHGMLAEANLTSLGDDYIPYTRRNHLLTHAQIDNVLNQVAAKGFNTPANQALFAVIFLAFYGGLRSGEIFKLKLNQIHHYEPVFQDGEFDVGDKPHIAVKVLCGKTGNAKRTVYLHVHAPKQQLENFIKLIASRKEMFKQRKEENISLLGYPKNKCGYVSSTLMINTRKAVKKYLGNKIDIHTLRHCFATWLDIRYMAAKYPKTKSRINADWEHEAFSEQGLACLMTFLNWGHRTFANNAYSHHYTVMAMIMGHGSIATTHQHYTHSHGLWSWMRFSSITN